MQKQLRTEYPEIDEIRQDLDSLKTNVVELSRHLTAEGKVQANRLSDVAIERLSDLRKSARDEYVKAERHVKSHPGQSIALAFGAGILASLLFSSRR